MAGESGRCWRFGTCRRTVKRPKPRARSSDGALRADHALHDHPQPIERDAVDDADRAELGERFVAVIARLVANVVACAGSVEDSVGLVDLGCVRVIASEDLLEPCAVLPAR